MNLIAATRAEGGLVFFGRLPLTKVEVLLEVEVVVELGKNSFLPCIGAIVS